MLFKQHRSIGVSFVLLLSIILASCGPVSLPAVNRDDSTPAGNQEPVIEQFTPVPPTEILTSATQAVSDVQYYINQDFGFSLSYPSSYELQSDFYHTILFLAPPETQGHRVRAFLSVEQAGEMTAEGYASRVKEENANLGVTITTSVMEIDGQQAHILGSVPGQDLNRQVFVVYKGILYHLTFLPDDHQTVDAYQRQANQQMETLYAEVIKSLRFLPERREVPPVLSTTNMVYHIERAAEARSEEDILRMLGDEFMVLDWLAPGVSFTRMGRNDAARAILNNHLTQAPDLISHGEMNWPEVAGSPEAFTGFFPNETITPVRVQGWGSGGSSEAVIIIARRANGSLYWRGVLVAQGTFTE